MAQPCGRHGGLPGRSDGVAGAAAVRRAAVGAAGGGGGPKGRGAELVAEGRAGGRPGGGDSAKGRLRRGTPLGSSLVAAMSDPGREGLGFT